MPKKSEGRYICRECSSCNNPTWPEIQSGRVRCPECGGTCDPSPTETAELKRRLKSMKPSKTKSSDSGNICFYD